MSVIKEYFTKQELLERCEDLEDKIEFLRGDLSCCRALLVTCADLMQDAEDGGIFDSPIRDLEMEQRWMDAIQTARVLAGEEE